MKKQKQIAIAMVAILLLSILTAMPVMSGIGDENVTNITNVNGTNETVIEETTNKEPMSGSGNANVTATSSITCNSCEDCSNKLNGKYDTVILTKDLVNVKGSCLTFGANNVVFDGNGHKIDGDDTGEFESGITMSSKSGNTIKNCVITDFESGITLYGSSKNKIYDNEVSSNYYDGIWISTNSDSNNIHDNRIEDNGKYGVYFSSDSNNNIFSKNVVCSNPTDIYDADKNSGDDNTCDTAHNWNDDGTNGCTYSCPVEKPDLIITDIQCDSKNHRIGYGIKNIGDATASKGLYTTLFVDGAFKIKEQVNVNLAPGTSSQRYFDYYSWECTPPQDTVKVCADYGDFVDESNEGNNCLEETCECVPPEKPDFVITDVWLEDSTIYYQIRNIGNATAPKGHYTALSIDGEPRVNDLVDVELAPGERLKRCFDYGWQCTSLKDTLRVCADLQDFVAESDEKNNCREETWKCDTTLPKIITGPTVSEITQSSVIISWITNEESDSLVRFGRTAGKYGDQKFSLKMKQEHKVILTDLLPSTTYHYVVESTDASENAVVSDEGFFETEPLSDSEPPTISNLTITRGELDFLYYEISADASDNVGVERVEFYMDDELIGTDYSEPYQCYMTPASVGMTWAEFLEEHTLEAVAIDECHTEVLPGLFDPPYECESIGMEMRHPHSDYTIYIEGDTVPAGTIVPIEVYAALEQESCSCLSWIWDPHGFRECRRFRCTTMLFPISEVEFYVNHVPIPNTSSGYVYTGNWDASGFPPGTYNIRVDAIASEDCKQTITREVSIEVGEPSLDVSRDVSRIGNYFQVELTVENHRTASVQIDKIEDNVNGFQPIAKSTADYDVITDSSESVWGWNCDIEIDLPGTSFTLGPDEHIHVEYLAVPVLYGPGADLAEYAIGAEDIQVYYSDGSAESFDRPCTLTAGGELLSSSVDTAIGASDYLIVTNPSRMVGYYSDAEINELLSLMGSLGKEKEGVLGYLDIYHRSMFKNLIEPDGDWSSRLTGDWTSTGYLLIVGETEIVPSFERGDTGIRDATEGWSGGPVYPVTCVDNMYADISGDDNLPELIVGRIIGDSADQLMTPIRTSLLDQFERTDALVVSGIDEDNPDAQTSFENNADEIADILDDEFTVDQMYGSDYTSDADRLTEFKDRTEDKDVIVYRDHGQPVWWQHIITIYQFPVNFGDSHPFVFGGACLTGQFEGHHCMGEAFLDYGAGVYIGSTESSSRSRNNEAAKILFDKWVNCPISIGQALKETKTELDVSDDRYRLWVMEYNLYGDPKYGASSAAGSSSASIAQEASQQPLSSLEVTVPDYVVTTRDGLDYVEIPGRQLLLVPDKPMVPFYTVSLDYAKGYKVQDVVLTERSGLVTATGLNLPTVISAQGGDGSHEPKTMEGSTHSGWFPDPEDEYRWQIIEKPDGSTTLLIMMYPFYYNPARTDVKFYKDYDFSIDYTSSTVEIAVLNTDKDAYQQGDDVLIDLWLNNSGDAQDVIVNAVVKAEGSDEVVDGLLLCTLKDLTGTASFSPEWDSSGVEPGYYYVEVTLKDTTGNVLDRTTEMFRLGISSGEIINFTATPEYFDIGDGIEINMTFNNTGTVNITGSAVIKVLNSTGYVVEEFRHNVTDLMPSESISFSDVWDTSEAEEGSYNIIGYVLYDSKATEPVTVIVTTVPIEKKPDLENVVHNNGTTVAPAGHYTTLYIDGEAVEYAQIATIR